MDMQCRLVTPTPIQYLGTGPGGQRIYIKRDDLLGFSFGGNKCRIAEVLLQDMREKGCDFFVSYGSRKSNLNRVVGTLCKAEKIPCLVITALEDGEKEDTFNSRILERMEIQSVFCDKSHVREMVEQTLADLREKGYDPYYIYGDSTGKGNEAAVRKAYAAAYEEIWQWEKQNRIYFRQIFHASGTGMTQGGLIAGQKAMREIECHAGGEAITESVAAGISGPQEQIIGISVARNAARGAAEVARFAGVPVDQVCFLDEYLCGGYGTYEEEIERTIEHVMEQYGIPLDPTYTGKAFTGMMKWLETHGNEGDPVLFIHTGGTPLYFDFIGKNMI